MNPLKIMKLVCLCFILGCLSVRCENSTHKVFLDLTDAEDNVLLWKNLFLKLNTVLNETEGLRQNLMDMNKRLDKISERQELQESTLSKLMASLQETRTIEGKVEDRQAENLSKILENVEDIRDDVGRVLETQRYTSTLSWTSILRRESDTVGFYRSWNEYRDGFGDPKGDFFIGLERLHNLTTAGPPMELLVILKNFYNHMRIAKYDHFQIGNETEKFVLKMLGSYSGDAGDAFSPHIGHKFTTYDQDNDDNDKMNCAVYYLGGWWFFGSCYEGYLSGPYRSQAARDTYGINWNPWTGKNLSLKYAEMLIRPKWT